MSLCINGECTSTVLCLSLNYCYNIADMLICRNGIQARKPVIAYSPDVSCNEISKKVTYAGKEKMKMKRMSGNLGNMHEANNIL